jgi:hypothetical protein
MITTGILAAVLVLAAISASLALRRDPRTQTLRPSRAGDVPTT